MAELIKIPAIDFLPVQYREKKVQRQTNAWRIGVTVLMVGTIATALACQIGLRYQAECELAALKTRHAAAQDQTQHLADLQRQLKAANEQANLYAYLQHPWPRTQICVAVTDALPEQVTLQELRIARETPAANNNVNPADRNRPKSRADETAELAKMSAAARDLRRLRDDLDKQQTVVSLSGVAADEEVMRSYLKHIAQNELFSKVEWGPVDKSEGENSHGAKFSVRLIVRPGYGQPGGPKGPQHEALVTKLENDPNTDSVAQRGEL